MKQKTYFMTVALLMIAALYGCGKNIGQDVSALSANNVNPQDASVAIAKPFETLGITDEAVAFNDADVVGEENFMARSKPEEVDATSSDLVCATSTSLETYFLTMRWGQFGKHKVVEGDEGRNDLTVMDWSGTITASSGQLTVVKTLLFEDRDRVATSTDPKVVAFTSHTKPGHDGLLVKYQRCMSTVTATSTPEDTIVFSAPNLQLAAFSKTWKVAQLVKLNEIDQDVDANHDLFEIQSLKQDRCEDGQGTINGVVFKTNEIFGQIKGRVVSDAGDPVGHIKGFYSVQANENGEHKVVAKFIRHDGQFKGILIGTGKDGVLSADIFNRDRVKVGTVTGRYVDGDASHKGTFIAIYELECAVPVEPPVSEPPK